MSQRVVNLISGATTAQKILTDANLSTPTVALLGEPTARWALHLNYEGLAGDGGDTFHPILQTSYDGGTTWLDLASTASMVGGVVAAVDEFVLIDAPTTAARKAASDGAINASTVNGGLLGGHVRLKGKFSDADHDGQWRINKAILTRYD